MYCPSDFCRPRGSPWCESGSPSRLEASDYWVREVAERDLRGEDRGHPGFDCRADSSGPGPAGSADPGVLPFDPAAVLDPGVRLGSEAAFGLAADPASPVRKNRGWAGSAVRTPTANSTPLPVPSRRVRALPTSRDLSVSSSF